MTEQYFDKWRPEPGPLPKKTPSYRRKLPGGGEATREIAVRSAVMDELDDPDVFAAYTIANSTAALDPEHGLYKADLSDLDTIIDANPGIDPDAAMTILTSGLPASSEIATTLTDAGHQLATAQRIEKLQEMNKQHAAMQAKLQGDSGIDNAFTDAAQAFTQVGMAFFDFFPQVAAHAPRVLSGVLHGEGNPVELGVQAIANTNFSMIVQAALDQITGTPGTEHWLDMGDGWFIDEHSPHAQTKYAWDQTMWGFKGAEASPGMNVSKTLGLGKDSALSALVDASFYLTDPWNAVGVGAIGRTLQRVAGVADKSGDAMRAMTTASALQQEAKELLGTLGWDGDKWVETRAAVAEIDDLYAQQMDDMLADITERNDLQAALDFHNEHRALLDEAQRREGVKLAKTRANALERGINATQLELVGNLERVGAELDDEWKVLNDFANVDPYAVSYDRKQPMTASAGDLTVVTDPGDTAGRWARTSDETGDEVDLDVGRRYDDYPRPDEINEDNIDDLVEMWDSPEDIGQPSELYGTDSLWWRESPDAPREEWVFVGKLKDKQRLSAAPIGETAKINLFNGGYSRDEVARRIDDMNRNLPEVQRMVQVQRDRIRELEERKEQIEEGLLKAFGWTETGPEWVDPVFGLHVRRLSGDEMVEQAGKAGILDPDPGIPPTASSAAAAEAGVFDIPGMPTPDQIREWQRSGHKYGLYSDDGTLLASGSDQAGEWLFEGVLRFRDESRPPGVKYEAVEAGEDGFKAHPVAYENSRFELRYYDRPGPDDGGPLDGDWIIVDKSTLEEFARVPVTKFNVDQMAGYLDEFESGVSGVVSPSGKGHEVVGLPGFVQEGQTFFHDLPGGARITVRQTDLPGIEGTWFVEIDSPMQGPRVLVGGKDLDKAMEMANKERMLLTFAGTKGNRQQWAEVQERLAKIRDERARVDLAADGIQAQLLELDERIESVKALKALSDEVNQKMAAEGADAAAAGMQRVAALRAKYGDAAVSPPEAKPSLRRRLADDRGAADLDAGPGRAAGDPADELDDLEWLRAAAGMFDEGGSQRAHLDTAVKFLFGMKTERLVEYLKLADDPAELWNLTRGQIDRDTLVKLADETDPAKIREELARAISDPASGLNMKMGSMRTLRAHARAALAGRDPRALMQAYAKAWGGMSKAMVYGRNRVLSNVPWVHAYSTLDQDGMVTAVSDTIGHLMGFNPTAKGLRRKKGRGWANAKSYHDEWVRKMLRAENPQEIRTVWYSLMTDLTERQAGELGLTGDEAAEFVRVLKVSRTKRDDAVSYLAEVREAGGGRVQIAGMDPEFWTAKEAAVLESEMTDMLFTPDWHEMRRAMKSFKDVLHNAQGKVSARRFAEEFSDALFEKWWRTSVLAFRGGYILRNLAEMQVRMFLSGHPSMFTSPLGLLSLAVANVKNGRLLKRLRRADYDVNGKVFGLPDDGDVMGDMVDEFRRLQGRTVSLMDPGASSRAKAKVGYREVGPDGGTDFYRGWANELGVMGGSELARMVLITQMVPRRGHGFRPRHSDWYVHCEWRAEQTGRPIEEVVTDYLWDGPGADTVKRMRDGSPTMKQVLSDRDALHKFLWDPEEAGSLLSRWGRLTDGWNHDLVEIVLQPRQARKTQADAAGAAGRPLIFTPEGLMDPDNAAVLQLKRIAEAKGWAQNHDLIPVQKVRAPVYQDKHAKGAAGRFVESAVDWFFGASNVIEKQFAYLPEFRYAKWESAVHYVGALSPEDAAKVIKTAEEALAGPNPVSWASKTLRELKAEAAKAKGTGAFTIDDLQAITDATAKKHMGRAFYDAQKRNQFAYAIRLAIPFAQAFVNSIEAWGRLAIRNPKRVALAGVAFRAGQTEDSLWWDDDPSNPENAVFYTDQQSGQVMIGIPVLGTVLGGLASATKQLPVIGNSDGQPFDPSLLRINAPVQSFNMVFQNGLLPGMGPGLQMPAMMLERTPEYQRYIPDTVKRMFVPYVNVNPDLDRNVLQMFTPGWMSSVLAGAGVPGYESGVEKYIRPAMAALYSQDPSKYQSVNGALTPNGANQLVADATALAHSLAFFRGFAMNMAPGGVLPDFLVKTADGELMSQITLTKEFNQLVAEEGSRENALGALMDKYGTNAMLSLMSKSAYSITPTAQAYEEVVDNPEIARDHGDVMSLFYPEGGYSPYMDRWQRVAFGNTALPADQMVASGNDLLKRARKAELDRKLIAGDIDEETYESLDRDIDLDFAGVPSQERSHNSRDVVVASIERALADNATLAGTDAGAGAKRYLAARKYAMEQLGEGDGFGGDDDAQLRRELMLIGEQIVGEHPSFRAMWQRVFRPELDNAEKSDAQKELQRRARLKKGQVTLSELRSTVEQLNDAKRTEAKEQFARGEGGWYGQDGDTVRTPWGEWVRLAGVDSVEKGEVGYIRARRFTRRFLRSGEPQLISPEGKDDRDHYDRLIRYILVHDRDLGYELIKRGLARPAYDSEWGWGTHPKETEYRELERSRK